MRVSPWLPSGQLPVALTLIWHSIGSNDTITMSALLMASPGGRSRGGTCVWRVSSRWEHTWARLRAPSTPKSILTPLKRLSASMALQCNYPVGNDISTQFLPASFLLGRELLPQASWWRLFVDHAGLRAVVIWSQRDEGWRSCGPRWWESRCYLISAAVLGLSLSQIECDVPQQAVKITDFSAVTKEDILWKLQALMISYDNLEKCSQRTYDRQSDLRW